MRQIIDMLNDPNVGDDAIYTPTSGTAVPTRVFFHQDWAPELGMEAYAIAVEGLTSVFGSAVHGETITVKGTTYKIKEPPHESDDGMSVIELSID
jgi:hypothetical protein